VGGQRGTIGKRRIRTSDDVGGRVGACLIGTKRGRCGTARDDVRCARMMRAFSPATSLNSFPALPRDAVRSLRASKIREVANAGIGRDDVLAFWFGEPDEVTPAFIREAGIESLNAGETFYSQNFGIPELRSAIARYASRLHGRVTPDQVAVTSSGMSALMVTTQALVGAGDRVVAVTPLWPNLVEIPKILAADVVCVPLTFAHGKWTLDADPTFDDVRDDPRYATLRESMRTDVRRMRERANAAADPFFASRTG